MLLRGSFLKEGMYLCGIVYLNVLRGSIGCEMECIEWF